MVLSSINLRTYWLGGEIVLVTCIMESDIYGKKSLPYLQPLLTEWAKRVYTVFQENQE